jgi:hypothetical protein
LFFDVNVLTNENKTINDYHLKPDTDNRFQHTGKATGEFEAAKACRFPHALNSVPAGGTSEITESQKGGRKWT